MPTDLPPGFTGTGKRSTPNPKISTEVNLPPFPKDPERPSVDDDEDFPTWAKIITLIIFAVLSWVLVGAVIWTVAQLVEFAQHLTS